MAHQGEERVLQPGGCAPFFDFGGRAMGDDAAAVDYRYAVGERVGLIGLYVLIAIVVS